MEWKERHDKKEREREKDIEEGQDKKSIDTIKGSKKESQREQMMIYISIFQMWRVFNR